MKPVKSGEIPAAQVDTSVERILRAKARAGLHRNKAVNLDAGVDDRRRPREPGRGRRVSERSITLLRDRGTRCRSSARREAQVLYLSVLDFRRLADRRAQPDVHSRAAQRWPNVTSIELSERTTPTEVELVRAMAPRFDAIVASMFVRAGSASGRMDLPAT